jgi:cystathionine beta-lyase/cystathionine gamma-synthase
VDGSRFADALKLFSITPSVGSSESLVLPPALIGGHDLTAAQRRVALLESGTVRLSIGIEDAADLVADLAQAFDLT